MIFQIDVSRIILVFVVGIIMASFFLFLGLTTMFRRKTRLNMTFSLFFISIALGLIINAAYVVINAVIGSEPLALTLNYISGFLIFYGTIFMLATNLILLHSEASYSLKSELKLTISYAFVLGAIIIFYFFKGIQFNESTNWRPVWSFPYFIYVLVVTTGFTMIPTVISSIKILKTMKDKVIRGRWLRLMIGLFGLFVYEYLAFFTNFLNIDTLRTISSIYSFLVILWVWLIYKGVKKD
jgi:hypothetical protein